MSGQAPVLTREQIQLVLNELRTPELKSLFGLGVYLGLRIGEIIRLPRESVYIDKNGGRSTLTVKRLKKRATVYSTLPLPAPIAQLLTAWLQELPQSSYWLFPGKSSHLSRQNVHLWLKRAFVKLGLPQARTHSMRRTCLTNLDRAGVSLRTIQAISGHANLGQLAAYLVVTEDDKDKALNLLKY